MPPSCAPPHGAVLLRHSRTGRGLHVLCLGNQAQSGEHPSGLLELAALSVDRDSLDHDALDKRGCSQFLGLDGVGERLVPASEQPEGSYRRGEQGRLSTAVADAAGQLEGTLGDRERLRPALGGLQKDGEIVVTPQGGGVQVVGERESQRALDQDLRLVQSVVVHHEKRLAVQPLGQGLGQIERLREREGAFEVRRGTLVLSIEDEEAAELSAAAARSAFASPASRAARAGSRRATAC